MNTKKYLIVLATLLTVFTLCFSISASAESADGLMTCNTEVSTDDTLTEEEDNSGVLAWFENVFNAIIELPEKIANALMFPEIQELFDVFDFSLVTDFFTEAYEGITTFFGIPEMIEGEDSPFTWLTPPEEVSE